MPRPRMFVPESEALSMLDSFRTSAKFANYRHLQRSERVYEEFSIPALIALTEKFQNEFPNFSDIKIYFVSSPDSTAGLAEISLLVCPVENNEDHQDTYILLSVYDALLTIGDPDAFNKAKCSVDFARLCALKYRDEFAKKFVRNNQQGFPYEDTRSLSYPKEMWNEFIEFLKNVKIKKVKAYLANNTDRGLTLLFVLQKRGQDIMVEHFENIPRDILHNPIPEPEGELLALTVFNTGNPCPPGSGGTPNICPGNGLEPA